MGLTGCPGAGNINGTPELEIKSCPACGAEVELFTNDFELACPECGFIVYNDIISCVRWCKMARECVGDERYEQLMALDEVKKAGQEAELN